MKALSCDFYPVETRGGTEVLCLEKPVLLVGEFLYQIFVERNGKQFHISGEGVTAHRLMAAGVDIVWGGWGTTYTL